LNPTLPLLHLDWSAVHVPVHQRSTPSIEVQASALWAEHKRVRRKYQALVRQYDKQKAKVPGLMPKPHPTITHSPENDATCMTTFHRLRDRDRAPNTVHAYIRPRIIEDKISEIENTHGVDLPIETADIPTGASMLTKLRRPNGKVECFAAFNAVQPLTLEQTQMLADLKGRLELSRAYVKKLDSVEHALGLPRLERGQDKVVSAMARIERQILKLPARSAGDTKIKLKLYARDRDEFCNDGIIPITESLVRDLRHILKQQTAPA
jgi:hypothetical protein